VVSFKPGAGQMRRAWRKVCACQSVGTSTAIRKKIRDAITEAGLAKKIDDLVAELLQTPYRKDQVDATRRDARATNSN
jgi:hypothetical protein